MARTEGFEGLDDSKENEEIKDKILASLKSQMDTQMKTAFFDLIDARFVEDSKLDEDTVRWMGTLLREVKDRILYLVRGEQKVLQGKRLIIYNNIEEGLDVSFFEQRIRHGVFSKENIGQLVVLTLTHLHDLQSPARDDALNAVQTKLFEDNPVTSFRMGKAFGDFIRVFHTHMDMVEKDLKFTLLYYEHFKRWPDMSVEEFESTGGK